MHGARATNWPPRRSETRRATDYRWRVRKCLELYFAQVQVKLVLSVESAEQSDVCGLLEVPYLLISMVLTAGNPPMAALVDSSSAQLVPVIPVLSLPKETVPKSDNGSMPPPAVQQGASVIHSADDRTAPETAEDFSKVFPVVSSVILMTNSPVLLS